MEWLYNLFCGEGIAHTVLIIAVTVSAGIWLGKIKFFGVSLGMTFVLFAGIALSHFGFRIEHHTLHFVKEFGLVLFVYAVGFQVGPGFVASFKKGGIRLNMLAMLIVLLGAAVTLVIHFVTGIPVATMVGIMSGAVTNTPGLGAAQEAAAGLPDATAIPLGYAVAYPLGVVGIIVSIIFIKVIFKVSFDKENEDLAKAHADKNNSANATSLEVRNPSIFGYNIRQISELVGRNFVVSRVCHTNGAIEIASPDTILNGGDKILVIVPPAEAKSVTAFIGIEIEMTPGQWKKLDSALVSRRIYVSHNNINGKSLGELKIRAAYAVNITRIHRAGIDLIAQPALKLQLGDRVTVVGSERAIASVEKLLGNQLQRLDTPNLIAIFFGIAIGVILGSIPFHFPLIPTAVKLGLAGGPLIIAILISIYGPKLKLITYTTQSAILMLRELGICLFLACVGLGAGEDFVETIVNKGGWAWIGWGLLITMIPLLITGAIARMRKINYFTIMGLLAGSTTDPPALAYSNMTANHSEPSVSYATVYPLTMFLRVIVAQLLILFFYA
ncbi:MAG: putative transporter [Bacteroidales bacterium]|jgi:putative transport protein|nr:putative transporter [Bacteroidales bacterium]